MNKKFKLENLGQEVYGKTVIVRCDLNAPIIDGEVIDSFRIEHSKHTIRYLKDLGAKVVVLSHFANNQSLRIVLNTCSEIWGMPVLFSDVNIGEAKEFVKTMSCGQVVILENVRFYQEEKENDPSFSKCLADIGDFYVNEAFSCCHRAHASIEGITHHIRCYAGFGLEKEVKILEEIKKSKKSELIAIIGGSKISTKISAIESLLNICSKVVILGAMAHTFLAASGHKLGNSFYEKDCIELAHHVLFKHSRNIILPKYFFVESEDGDKRLSGIDEIGINDKIVDVFPENIKDILEDLSFAKTVIWNGPAGMYEKHFEGTFYLCSKLCYMSENGVKVVAAGGDTLASFQLARNFYKRNPNLIKQKASHPCLLTHFSTGGGAFLYGISNDTMPGLAFLAKKSVIKLGFEN